MPSPATVEGTPDENANGQATQTAQPSARIRHHRRVRHAPHHEPTQSRFSFDEESRPRSTTLLNPEESSSNTDEDGGSESESESWDQMPDGTTGMDLDGDEFDPYVVRPPFVETFNLTVI